MERARAFYDAIIHTMNPAMPRAEAIGVRAGRIVSVGSNDEVRERMGRAEAIELGGGTVVPGLIDAHLHFVGLSVALTEVELLGSRSIAEAAERVAARAHSGAPGEWIVGHGWNANVLDDARWPCRQDLDRLVPDRPVTLISQDHHSCWVNSCALAAASISKSTPDPPDGRIERDVDGEPTGLLVEGATRLVRAVLPEPDDEQLLSALGAGQREANKFGLTSIGSMEDARALRALQRLRTARGLTLRVYQSIPADSLQHAIGLGITTGFGDEWLRLGHLKIFADGALGSRSAHMLAPYEGEPSNTGIVLREADELGELIVRAARAGIASCIHAIGDAANRVVLDRYEEATRAGLLAGLRPRIEHAQLLDACDIPRFGRLGVVASMQPIHCTSDMHGIDQWWGTRGRGAYAFRSLLRDRAVLAFGSDAPVDSLSPLAGMHAAVTRQDATSQPADGWYPDERLTAYEALRAYTLGAAFASGEEAIKGSLEPGKLADLTVLSDDVLAIEPSALLTTTVRMTVVGGEVVFSV